MLILSLETTSTTMLIGLTSVATILGLSHPTTMGTTLILPLETPLQKETLLKDFITTKKAFNKSVEEKLDKLDILSSKVDNIAHDVEMFNIRTSPPEQRQVTPMTAIQVQIDENIRMLGKLKERRAREKEEEDRIKSLPTYHTVAIIQVVEEIQTVST